MGNLLTTTRIVSSTCWWKHWLPHGCVLRVTDAVVSREQVDIPFKIHENSVEPQQSTDRKKLN